MFGDGSTHGGPAESNFGKVAGADNKTAKVVCHVHKYLRAFSCLRVFVGYVSVGLLVSDIIKMNAHGIKDIYFLKGYAKCLAKLRCV